MASSKDESSTDIYVKIPADNRDCSYLSSHSSLSDPDIIELPNDIYDEPKFDDLAGHLESVASSAWLNCANHVQNQTVSPIGPPLLTTAAKSNNPSWPKSQSGPFSEFDINHPVDADNSEFEAVSPFDTPINALPGSSNWPSGLAGGLISKTPQLNGQLDAESVEIWSPGSVQLSEDEEDDFGEFISAPLCEPQTQKNSTSNIPDDFPHSVAENPGTLERLLSHLEPALQSAFSQNLEFTESMGSSRRQAVESSGSPTVDCGDCQEGAHPSSLSASTHLGIWHRLFTPTRLTELQQQWSNSSVQHAFLQSINVKTKPAFASHLGLLQPVKVSSVPRKASADKSSRRETNLSNPNSTANAGELQGPEILVASKFSQSNPVTQYGCENKSDYDLQPFNST